ncbi:MAG TPA: hypothetical protein VFS48_03660 [Solirubrobacterales bacterium]|nr:hypothetical protein [Solirubrobacterales bacterium]
MRYAIEVNNGWRQVADEKPVAGFLESAWLNPVGPSIVIDTRLADEIGSPMANAQLAQIQTSKLPGYRERGMRWIKLGGRPAVRWGFDVGKEESRIEFFFEECDTSFIVRGSMSTYGFQAYAESIGEMSATISVEDCDE